MMCAGLKKCSPATRPGWAVKRANSVTDRVEVLLAMSLSAGTTASSFDRTSFLTSRSSKTASTTTSAVPASSSRVLVLIRLMRRSAVAWSIRPRLTPAA